MGSNDARWSLLGQGQAVALLDGVAVLKMERLALRDQVLDGFKLNIRSFMIAEPIVLGLGLLLAPALFVLGFALLAPLALVELLKPVVYDITMDTAGMALFLCSDAASWITGQTYPLNGGYVTD